MDKKLEIKVHLAFWILFITYDVAYSLVRGEPVLSHWALFQNLSFTGLELMIFYLGYSFLFPNTVPAKKWGRFSLGILILTALFIVLRYGLEEVVLYKITGVHNYTDDSRLWLFYTIDNLFFSTRIVVLSLALYLLKSYFQQRKRAEAAMVAQKYAELGNLKNQISPHFLFNALNSFYADLMDTEPKIAADLLKLSEMLRYVTYENKERLVSLAGEIQFLKNYIALFSRRYEGQLAVDFQTSKFPEATKIAPLILIHFVENAMKHGIITDSEKPVRIELYAKGDQLFFKVGNHFEPSEHYSEKGIGYENVQKRLSLLYPQNHQLTIRQTKDVYRIELQIPLNND